MTQSTVHCVDAIVQEFRSQNYGLLRASTETRTDFFLARFAPSAEKSENLNPSGELDTWVNSDDGQQTLTTLVKYLVAFVGACQSYALPAHDLRQILFKDLAEALRFASMEKLTGAKASGVIPAGFHDVGRLLEGMYYNPDTNPINKGIPHAQLSFLIFQEILDLPDFATMPRDLKDHYLYAVLAHSGQNGQTFMSRMTQACDRTQLIGPEGFFRALGFVVALMEGEIAYPQDEECQLNLPDYEGLQSVVMELEFFARNMRENIGEAHAVHRHDIAVQNVALLLLACSQSPDLEKRIFGREKGERAIYGPLKKKIPVDVWAEAESLSKKWIEDSVDEFAPNMCFAATLVDMLQSPPDAAPLDERMVGALLRAVEDLLFLDKLGIYYMASKAEDLRSDGDVKDIELAQELCANVDTPLLLRTLAGIVSAYRTDRKQPEPTPQVGISPCPA